MILGCLGEKMRKNLVRKAIAVARLSKEEFQVGAILYKGSSIIRKRFNTGKYIGYRKNVFTVEPTRHAEIACLHQVPRDILKGSSILVVRVQRDGKLTCSKPCLACYKAMVKSLVTKIYYSDYDGKIIKQPIDIPFSTYKKDVK